MTHLSKSGTICRSENRPFDDGVPLLVSSSRSENLLKALLPRHYSFMSLQCHNIIKERAVLMVHFIPNKRESLPSMDQSILSVVTQNGTRAQLMASPCVKKDVLPPGLTEYVNITKPIYPFMKQMHFYVGIWSIVIFYKNVWCLIQMIQIIVLYLFLKITQSSHSLPFVMHNLYKIIPNMIYINEPSSYKILYWSLNVY